MTARHECLALQCSARVPGKLAMCSKHWQMVDPEVRENLRGLADLHRKSSSPSMKAGARKALWDLSQHAVGQVALAEKQREG